MFFDVYVPFRAKKELLDKIENTINENPDREFESRGHFIRSAVLYYCRYLDDLKYKAGLEKIRQIKEVKKWMK